MVTISEEQGKAILRPHHPALIACVRAGWRLWEDFRERVPLCPPTPRANLIWAGMIAQARIRFAGFPGVRTSEPDTGRFLIQIPPLVVQLKKLDSGLRTSNYPTQTALRFDKQLWLPFIPAGTRVTVGYVLNALETDLAGIYAVCADGPRVLWHYDIVEAEASPALSLPLSTPTTDKPERVRVRRRQEPGSGEGERSS